MQYQVSIINSVKIVLQDGKRIAFSLPCDRNGNLFIKWNTNDVEKLQDKHGAERRRLAIEKSPREGYFSSHEQRIPRRFHFAFYMQLKKIYNIESWNCSDIKSMRTCWCYVIKPKTETRRRRRGIRRTKR